MKKKQSRVANGLAWKLMERFGVQGVQFVLQIVLARILDPAHYGVLSLMVIFTTLANVFIQGGFNTALIQNKDVTEDDYSSVFWVSLGVAGLLYAVLFFSAPLISQLYKTPDLETPFRVLCLMLFPGAMNSVQLAKVSRKMDFFKVFISNIGGIVISGVVGIIIALNGGGLWALVAQTLLNSVVACIVMRFTVNWKIRFVCNLKRIKILFSYGWKLLTSSLIDAIYQDIRSLVIGVKYDSETLGFYNRGKQFPQFIISAINSSVQSVLLPAMSEQQDSKSNVKQLMRTSVKFSSYIIFPMMMGLAGVAAPLIELLLTEKWLPCVPYLQIYCFSLAFIPVHTSNLQAINAMGRSDIFLKLELIKKGIGMIALVIAVFCFDSPIAIALTGIVTSLISCFINAYPNVKLIGYSFSEQIRDILPAFLLSVVMFAVVMAINQLSMGPILKLIVQIAVGIAVYFAGSAIFRFNEFTTIVGMLKGKLKRTH